MKLTQLQKELIRSYSRADIRSPQQMLALLLAEGFRFLYFDKETIEPVGVTAKEAVDLILNELKTDLLKDD
jgi:hypothetical protein